MKIFGPRNQRIMHVDVDLPRAIAESKKLSFTASREPTDRLIALASGRCVITVNTIGMPELASWYPLYLAAVAIDAMCVRQGLSGIVSRLGKSCQMSRQMEMTGADPFLGSDDSLVVTIGDRDIKAGIAATS